MLLVEWLLGGIRAEEEHNHDSLLCYNQELEFYAVVSREAKMIVSERKIRQDMPMGKWIRQRFGALTVQLRKVCS